MASGLLFKDAEFIPHLASEAKRHLGPCLDECVRQDGLPLFYVATNTQSHDQLK